MTSQNSKLLDFKIIAKRYLNFNFCSLNFEFNKGYAVITMLLIALGASLAVISAYTFFSMQEVNVDRIFTKSVTSRYISESGLEDATYRLVTGKQLAGYETLNVGTGSTTIYLTSNGGQRTVLSQGKQENLQQNLQTEVDINTDAVSFYYGVQVGDGGLEMNNGAQINGNVYSNGNIDGGTVTGSATVAGGIAPNPNVIWSANDSDQFFATSSASRDIAQSFTATASGALTRVSVYLGKAGSPSSNLTLRIVNDNNGKPDNDSLASTSIPPSLVGATPSWIDASFSTPSNLTNGSKYWIVLDYGTNSTSNYWNWRKDSTNGYANNTGKYTSDWSQDNANWTNVNGDLNFRVWIGGVTTQISNATIGGTGRANVFINDTIQGSACPNQYCIVDNPPRQNMPIPDGVIQDWRNEAAAGGTCAPPLCDSSGNLNLDNGASKIIGPLKIPGNLTINNGSTLTVAGTIWVAGNINFSNNCIVQLSSSYGALSGVVVTDGTINVSNGCTFSGSGTPGSYFMLLSAKNTPTQDVISVNNNSTGVVYYASNGKIEFDNNSAAKEATGYGIDMGNNATITYESGLQNANFSSGPGASYQVKYWREVE